MPDFLKNKSTRLYLFEWIDFRKTSAQQLAKRIKTSKSVISKLGNGKQRYNQDWLEKIAEGLQCDPVDLLRHPQEHFIEAKFRSLPMASRVSILKKMEQCDNCCL
ncbi:helix-turn-helix domain-containing protein [Brucella gallinifaecis]|uniref:Helix-turn-helix transcriptional regulator n=1 Tax=Brucella gallinifaecis TaxID=215590 RepID=A0A502BI27_9HYPH|nr:helix-turn-helix transcriptional regulator [Brucella gallinifaecis]TPF73960.1 helix-turn-helix transcriptional regulator [Brucella gallinifaecis]